MNSPRPAIALRVAWTVTSIVIVNSVVCAIAAAPVVTAWAYLLGWTNDSPWPRILVCSVAAVPSYAAFALMLMFASALSIRVLGWHTPPDAEMPLATFERPLLIWVRYMTAIHLVRLLAGTLVRGTPVWTAYLRLCGARLGRRVYVNSLTVSDYNMLEFGDDVVIGADAHVSGHTVERGVVKTGTVRLGSGVTIGVGSVVEIGVTAGNGCQVGALSFVPKYARLEAGTTYVGIPVRPVPAGGEVHHEPI